MLVLRRARERERERERESVCVCERKKKREKREKGERETRNQQKQVKFAPKVLSFLGEEVNQQKHVVICDVISVLWVVSHRLCHSHEHGTQRARACWGHASHYTCHTSNALHNSNLLESDSLLCVMTCDRLLVTNCPDFLRASYLEFSAYKIGAVMNSQLSATSRTYFKDKGA